MLGRALLTSCEARAFVRLRRASNFLLSGQEKVAKEKTTLLGAARQVHELAF
jgi:hypothetical protein